MGAPGTDGVFTYTIGTELENLADYLVSKLSAEGIAIQRYDAYSSNSIYLKLDYGILNSIRISDHPGKKYLKYRYNIGSHIKKFCQVKDKYLRYYYPSFQSKELVKRILSERESKLKQYGWLRYWDFMEKNKREKGATAGFWKQAVLVVKGEFEK